MSKTKKATKKVAEVQNERFVEYWQANPDAEALCKVGDFVFVDLVRAEEYAYLTGATIEKIYKDGKTTGE